MSTSFYRLGWQVITTTCVSGIAPGPIAKNVIWNPVIFTRMWHIT
jgi:hypothetical protein